MLLHPRQRRSRYLRDQPGTPASRRRRSEGVALVPCQAFSHAGLRKGLHDPRGQLIVEFKCLVNECMPKVFFVENVKGLKSHDGGNTLKILIGFFEDDSYSVSYEVLNSFHY